MARLHVGAVVRATDRSVAGVCLSVGLSSLGWFTTSFARTFGLSPTAYRAALPPAADHALVPASVVCAYARPRRRPLREDGAPPPGQRDHAPSPHPEDRQMLAGRAAAAAARAARTAESVAPAAG